MRTLVGSFLVAMVGCAAHPAISNAPPVAVASSTPSATPAPSASFTPAPSASTPAPPAAAFKRAASFSLPAGTGVLGPAFTTDGKQLVFAVAGKLHRLDGEKLTAIDARVVGKAPRVTGTPIVLQGAAFDVATAARFVLPVPKGYTCEGDSFSADGSKVAWNCNTPQKEFVLVQDARTGATVAELDEFQTAAPVRGGEITASGNFVFWSARASGAFEEIKSKVTGPVVSSHSTMAPDERALFTVNDRNWMPDDRTPAKVLDPKTGRTKYVLSWDIERVDFSPDSSRFAALHAPKDDRRITHVTVHRTDDGEKLADLPIEDAELVAFTPDARAFVVRAKGSLTLWTP